MGRHLAALLREHVMLLYSSEHKLIITRSQNSFMEQENFLPCELSASYYLLTIFSHLDIASLGVFTSNQLSASLHQLLVCISPQ